MSSVLAVIAVLSGLLVLLLAVPIDVAFRWRGVEAAEGQIAIGWLFGLVKFRVLLPDTAKPPARTASQAVKPRARRDARTSHGQVLVALRQAAFRHRAYRLLRDLLHAVRLRELRLGLRLGLGDPADTGLLWALVGPLNAAAQNLRNARVRIEPDFIAPAFEVEAHGRCMLVPLQILLLVIVFALSPASIRAWRTLRRAHA